MDTMKLIEEGFTKGKSDEELSHDLGIKVNKIKSWRSVLGLRLRTSINILEEWKKTSAKNEGNSHYISFSLQRMMASELGILNQFEKGDLQFKGKIEGKKLVLSFR